MTKAKKTSHKGLVAGGLGLAAASVAAIAGGYLLYGSKDATKNRKKVKGWMLKAKGEILEKIEDMEEISEDKYHEIVEMVSKKYSGLKNVDAADLMALTNDAKKHWKVIHTKLAPKAKKAPAKKTATKKATKKTTK